MSISIVPALASFATPYSANDVLGGVNTVLVLSSPGDGIETLGSVAVIDKAKQKKEFDLFFFDSLPVISADNAAFDLTDAYALGYIGHVSIAAADYIDSASNSFAVAKGVSLKMPDSGGGQTIYCVAVTRSTPTYGSATDLMIRLEFYRGQA